jgi:hypothetical protein
MKRWVIKRKYQAFVQLDRLLRTNFENICIKAELLGLPQDGGHTELQLIKEFLEALTKADGLLETAPVRQFLEVPASRALFDLSNDPTRSIFSSSLVSLTKGKFADTIPHSVTLTDVIMLTSVVLTALPLLAGVPINIQPFAASWAMIVCSWYVSQKEGLFDYLTEKVWGHELIPFVRSMVRPADMPGFWMTVGVLVGFALGGHRHAGFLYGSGVFAARIMVLFALANFAFITGVATNKIKVV